VAPYFVDEEAGADSTAPVGGLTVIAFRNSHLVYAITWYGLALMVLVGAGIVIREERRRA
jgi:surfeit locus 1 family protein